jgi:opacity protein-like surface antigen
MKRLLIIPVLLFTVVAHAQIFNVFGQDIGFIKVGPKVGMTLSSISNFSKMADNSIQYRLGYQVGAVGEFGFTSKFSIQTELLFSSRGAKIDAENSKIKMNYIGLPVLAKYAFKAMGLTKVYAMGGTFTDIRTKGVEEYGAIGAQPGYTVNLPSGFKKYDFGLAFGAGAEYPTKLCLWALDFRYNYGLIDITDSSLGNVKTKSRSFGFTLTGKIDMVELFSGSKSKKKDGDEETKGGSKGKPGLKVDRSK